MRLAIGSDHRGFQAKSWLGPQLEQLGLEVVDVGTHGEDSVDYPDIAALVAKQVSSGEVDRGLLICGTGIGMCIAANKFPGVRAATCHDEATIRLSRQHNNLNVLGVPGSLENDEALRLIQLWLATDFEGGRHARRVAKIDELEQENLKSE